MRGSSLFARPRSCHLAVRADHLAAWRRSVCQKSGVHRFTGSASTGPHMEVMNVQLVRDVIVRDHLPLTPQRPSGLPLLLKLDLDRQQVICRRDLLQDIQVLDPTKFTGRRERSPENVDQTIWQLSAVKGALYCGPGGGRMAGPSRTAHGVAAEESVATFEWRHRLVRHHPSTGAGMACVEPGLRASPRARRCPHTGRSGRCGRSTTTRRSPSFRTWRGRWSAKLWDIPRHHYVHLAAGTDHGRPAPRLAGTAVRGHDRDKSSRARSLRLATPSYHALSIVFGSAPPCALMPRHRPERSGESGGRDSDDS